MMDMYMQRLAEERLTEIERLTKERDEALEKLAAMESVKPDGYIASEGSIKEGLYSDAWVAEHAEEDWIPVYIGRPPVPADKPAVAVPDDLCKAIRLIIAETRRNNTFTDDQEGIAMHEAFHRALDLIDSKMDYHPAMKSLSSAPSHSQQSAADSDHHISMSDDPVWTMFGLTYASWLVWPRVVMQAMDLKWQRKFVALASELNERFPDWAPDGDLEVGLRVNGKMQKLPDDLCNYRHPVDKYRRPLIDRCPSHESEQGGGR